MEYSPSEGIQVEETMRTGSYIGDGVANRVINIEFTPKAIWIYNETDDPVGMEIIAVAVAIEGHHSQSGKGGAWIKNTGSFQGIVENGFKTGTSADSGTNMTDNTYLWIASP